LFDKIPDIDEKAMAVEGHCFDKMIVKYRQEIVALGKVVNQQIIANSHQEISLAEFKRLMESQDENVAILDMRNDYEYQI
jgi:predicted sulfurtransferase